MENRFAGTSGLNLREMRILSATIVLLLAGVSCFAQQSSNSSSNEQSSQQSGDKQSSGSQQHSAKPSAADANPFPEAESRKAEEAASGTSTAAPAAKPASPGYSSSKVDLKRLDAPEGSESRISNGAGGYIHDPQLAAHDDKVGNFYLQTGDYKGAYDRFKEATLVAPEDADAVFGLAEAARGLHLNQDAINNYKLYLDVFPDGKRSKEARKALAHLGAAPKK